MRAIYKHRKGLPGGEENRNLELYGCFPAIRMTIPAREALEKAAQFCEGGWYYFKVPPKEKLHLVTVQRIGGSGFEIALRCENEPEFPSEHNDTCRGDYWMEALILPCPVCGAALAWYEAGYVPGYRICAGKEHHHCLIK